MARDVSIKSFFLEKFISEGIRIPNKLELSPKMDQVFQHGEARLILCYSTHEEKINYKHFTEIGSYGNQPQPYKVLFNSIDANISYWFTKPLHTAGAREI